MRRNDLGKHEQPLPNLRRIRRSCRNELYRAAKRLNTYIPPAQMEEAEALYFRKVTEHLLFIAENGNNRRKLADWWEEHVCADVAELWRVEPERLARAFRSAFGG